ncbi:MAG: hypothetical protein J6N53_16430 [Lachnospiraceae bacterium]|nr:hypothetical protein [Lachnospiraceae bacterium]
MTGYRYKSVKNLNKSVKVRGYLLRQFGNKIYIDLEIAAKGEITLFEAHEIAESVHSGVEKEFPKVIMIHVNPVSE